jgi:putative tryptophan/tyrosine transport system substrate-binding protein
MRRREFISLLGGAAAAWPLSARAQQSPMPVVGFLNGATATGWAPFVAAFRQGLNETGYIEGKNVAIEYRFAEGEYDRLPAMAADLVHRRVSVIAATTTPAALAAKAATTTVPVVFTTTGDPVQMGLVASLSRPGGNITGVTRLNVEIAPKLLELMHELVPTATRIVLLVNPTGPNAETLSKEIGAAARALGLEVPVLHATTERDFDKVFSTFAQLSAGALVIGTDPFFTTRSQQLAALTLRSGVPAIYSTRAFATSGGLMCYGGSITDVYRLAGGYAARILRGEKPADLPVQQSAKVELVINLKTAKTLGITVPNTIIGRADEVIE